MIIIKEYSMSWIERIMIDNLQERIGEKYIDIWVN